MRSSGGLAYRESDRRIEGGFVLELDGLTLYGDTCRGLVQSLAVAQISDQPIPPGSIAQIRALAGELELDLVDWCRCARVAADRCDFDRLLAETGA